MMKKIESGERRVANIHTADFVPFYGEDQPETGEDVLQVNPHNKTGVGFHVYRMAPGTRTVPHEHTGDEEFLVLDGELVDNDGYVYRAGDLVWLKEGTQHSSHSRDGALLAVYIAKPESGLE